MTPFQLVMIGCGTVNHHNAEVLFPNRSLAAHLLAFDTVDCKTVSERNGHTVPWLWGHEGEPKAVCLRERVMAQLGRPLEGAAYYQDVETIDWNHLLASRCRGPCDGRMVFVLMGLDNWSARVSAVTDIRHAVAAVDADVLVVQAAVDRGQSQVSTFGPCWADPCPVCGLLAAPATEPCVVFREGGRLLRGDLQREASAAAAQVLTVVKDCLDAGSISQWRNRKINLVSNGTQREFARFTRARSMVSGCWGPHSPHTPLRLKELFAD
jgi:hypothetical protein